MNKNHAYWIVAACLAGCLCLSTSASAQGSPGGAAVVSSVDVTVAVTRIDHKTRAVTLKGADGTEISFTVGDAVKNLDQVKKGDVVTASYTQALAYEVIKGGTPGADTTFVGARAVPGAKPAGFVGRNTTVTAVIVTIDATAPSLTFKGPAGNQQTVKVASADKLQGLSVGDTVTLSYTEAVAVRVEKAKKQEDALGGTAGHGCRSGQHGRIAP